MKHHEIQPLNKNSAVEVLIKTSREIRRISIDSIRRMRVTAEKYAPDSLPGMVARAALPELLKENLDRESGYLKEQRADLERRIGEPIGPLEDLDGRRI